MVPYEDLDAFKASHELTLQVHRTVERMQKRDPELASQLWQAAFCCSSRIVRGWAWGGPRRLAACVDRAIAALSEMGYYLSLARAIDLVTESEYNEIESVRGRAKFYVGKLLLETLEPPEEDEGPEWRASFDGPPWP